jgi:sulfide dehydrogenase cytochrome subunit
MNRKLFLNALSLAAWLALPAPAHALDAGELRMQSLVATCAQCHGTDGHAVAGQAMVRLAGLPKDHILGQLLAFRSGQRPATIMHQISRGYSQEQLGALADYFSKQK